MDTKVIVGVVIAVLALAVLPFVPKMLKGMRGPDPERDAKTAVTIQNAVQDYQMKKGARPPSLDALVPDFLASLPKTSIGQDFMYDPSTGQVISPTPMPQAAGDANPKQRGPVTVGGPMGETMTSIGIAEELN